MTNEEVQKHRQHISTTILLLVEDEPAAQELLRIALQDAGYDLVTASTGTEAFAELDKGAERFRAVITDIKIGSGPDGWDVGHHARELVPSMPIVYMSGDSAHEWSSKGVPNSIMVSKPFAVAQIVTAVSALLVKADSTLPIMS